VVRAREARPVKGNKGSGIGQRWARLQYLDSHLHHPTPPHLHAASSSLALCAVASSIVTVAGPQTMSESHAHSSHSHDVIRRARRRP
jgi:hypothetical protein